MTVYFWLAFGVGFGVVWFLNDYLIHKLHCWIAVKSQKPVCRCWDCKNPCAFWSYRKEVTDNDDI